MSDKYREIAPFSYGAYGVDESGSRFLSNRKPLYNGASRSEPSGLKLLGTKLKKKTLQNYAALKEIELMGI